MSRSIHYLTMAFLAVVSVSCGKTSNSELTNRPNVIFIMADDHTSQAVSAYGGILADVSPTPNIDRVASEGMLFQNCFVTNSICTPSRSAIMTGRYAHKNGVYKFTALNQTQPTLPKAMQAAGYHTALIGKYHLHSNPVGLDYYSLLPGQGRYHSPQFVEVGDTHPSGWLQQGKRTTYEGHSSDVIADKVLAYLQNERDKEKPFMLFAHFKAPHDTWEYAERYENYLADVEIPEPANLFDDYEGRSDALRTQLQYIGSDWGDHTNFEEETAHLEGDEKRKMQYQLYMKKYLRCVKGVDDNVGRILDYLDEAGLTDNTIIMYTGDQGFYLGEHNLYDKRFMYEEGLRMPFLVRWPGKVEAGVTSEGMVLNVDFAPTILEAVQQPMLPGTQGRSFLSLLEGQLPDDWRTSMFYRYYYSHFETEPHYGVRTYDHKLIYYNRIDQWELYDLNQDRAEMNNLYDDPQSQEIVAALKTELTRLQSGLGDDPDDDGSRPDIGALDGSPVYQNKDIRLQGSDASFLLRFRTEIGGTLLSRCRIGDVPWSQEIADEGLKSLFINNGELLFADGLEEDPISVGEGVADNQWHTIAMIVKDSKPRFFIDGQLSHEMTTQLTPANANHTFNLGAGVDFGGELGFNFQGELAEATVYEGALGLAEVSAFAHGDKPAAEPLMTWPN